MNWASHAIKLLQEGTGAVIKPRGHSMEPRVIDGATVHLEPIKLEDLAVGDVVLCKVKGRVFLHLVKAVDKSRVLIGNNKGYTNGWTGTVYGRAVRIEQ